MIQAAVSRQREFLADASAVQFTRNPGGLTGALKKSAATPSASDMVSHRTAELGHFFFAQGFRSNFGGLWATHPPLTERIRRRRFNLSTASSPSPRGRGRGARILLSPPA